MAVINVIKDIFFENIRFLRPVELKSENIKLSTTISLGWALMNQLVSYSLRTWIFI